MEGLPSHPLTAVHYFNRDEILYPVFLADLARKGQMLPFTYRSYSWVSIFPVIINSSSGNTGTQHIFFAVLLIVCRRKSHAAWFDTSPLPLRCLLHSRLNHPVFICSLQTLLCPYLCCFLCLAKSYFLLRCISSVKALLESRGWDRGVSLLPCAGFPIAVGAGLCCSKVSMTVLIVAQV